MGFYRLLEPPKAHMSNRFGVVGCSIFNPQIQGFRNFENCVNLKGVAAQDPPVPEAGEQLPNNTTYWFSVAVWFK